MLLAAGCASSSLPDGEVPGHIRPPEHRERGGRGTAGSSVDHPERPRADRGPSLPISPRSPAPSERASALTQSKPARSSSPAVRLGGRLAAGVASWYGTGRNGLYAAAGPALRSALGPRWRGRRVAVLFNGRRVVVTLNDYCPCGERSKRPDKLIDLSDEAFRRLAPLSRGVLRVTIRAVH